MKLYYWWDRWWLWAIWWWLGICVVVYDWWDIVSGDANILVGCIYYYMAVYTIGIFIIVNDSNYYDFINMNNDYSQLIMF